VLHTVWLAIQIAALDLTREVFAFCSSYSGSTPPGQGQMGDSLLTFRFQHSDIPRATADDATVPYIVITTHPWPSVSVCYCSTGSPCIVIFFSIGTDLYHFVHFCAQLRLHGVQYANESMH
jgi:hypothetical protein